MDLQVKIKKMQEYNYTKLQYTDGTLMRIILSALITGADSYLHEENPNRLNWTVFAGEINTIYSDDTIGEIC